MIVIENISKSFDGKLVIDDISGQFEQGKTNLIIGASGTGKTVLLKCIVGLIKPDQGNVIYDGRDFTHADRDLKTEVRREIGMLFQGGALFDSKSVQENVMFPLNVLTRMGPEEKLDRVNFCLQRVGLDNVNSVQGMMVRDKPAACFYMGAFFAESLILAETGNSIGAIQIAGTAMPAQLPFFVAACDYTLIGEEFFAASAYLTGSPEELGSLKGQDVGKVLVAAGLVGGVLALTLATIVLNYAPGSWLGLRLLDAVSFFKDVMLT